MDLKALDKALQELTKKREELKSLDYSNPKYDEIEEQLHDMEDDFLDSYGDFMEEILQDVHDKCCPDSDVLLPIAYMGDGVLVEADNYPGKEVKLILLSNPLRIVMSIGKDKKEIVWTGEEKTA